MNDARPYRPGTFWVDVLPFDGFTPGGIYVVRPEKLYPILGRVGRTYQCRYVKEGEVIRFPPLSYEYVQRDDGRMGTLMDERVVLCVIEGFDEAAQAYLANADDAVRYA